MSTAVIKKVLNLKRFLFIVSFLIFPISAQAITRDTLCIRYGLTPSSEDFRRCINEPQSKTGVAAPKTPAKPTPAAPNAEVDTSTPAPIDISKLVVVYQPDADAYYSSFSKRSGEQGAGVVRLIINETGNVEDVLLLKSSSVPRLDRAAAEIGKRYVFKPFLVNGKPARISTNLLIKFNLKTD